MSHLTEFILPHAGIHYWVSERRQYPTVVLLHGATMDHRMFDAQVAVLIHDYDVVSIDVRGHGKSQPLNQPFTLPDCAADVIALLDYLHLDQVILVGQSMGGYIAQYVYLQQPQRVSTMVIIGATSIAHPYTRWEIFALKASLPLLKLWPYEHFVRTVARSVAIKPAVQAYALDAGKQIARSDFLTIWHAVTLAISKKGLPGHHIRVPLLITHGDHDGQGSIRKLAPGWAASEPNAQHVIVPDAGHNANQDNPEFFNRLLLDFLSKLGREEK